MPGRNYSRGFVSRCLELGLSRAGAEKLLKTAAGVPSPSPTASSMAPLERARSRGRADRHRVAGQGQDGTWTVDQGAPSMTAAPKKSLLDQAGDYLGNVGSNLYDFGRTALYRLGLGGDESYIRHVRDDTRRRASGNGAIIGNDDLHRIQLERLFGNESHRGDAYEHAASRQDGVMSTSAAGRALGASQPLPNELYYMGDYGVPYGGTVRDLNPGAIPGMATAVDVGSYFTPAGVPMFARDIAQAAESASDGNYGEAVALAAMFPAVRGVGRLLGRIPRIGRAAQRAVVPSIVGLQGVSEAADTMDRNRYLSALQGE